MHRYLYILAIKHMTLSVPDESRSKTFLHVKYTKCYSWYNVTIHSKFTLDCFAFCLCPYFKMLKSFALLNFGPKSIRNTRNENIKTENIHFKWQVSMYLIADVTDTIYFIGATDIAKEGNWEWNGSKTPLVFTDWGHGQPDHLNHTENCLALRHAGFQWHDYPCHDHHRFICAAER